MKCDIERHAQEILSLRERLNGVYSKHTGQTVEVIAEALERDNFMEAEAAKEFGLIDKVIDNREIADDVSSDNATNDEVIKSSGQGRSFGDDYHRSVLMVNASVEAIPAIRCNFAAAAFRSRWVPDFRCSATSWSKP